VNADLAEYDRQLARFLERVPSLARYASAVYAVRSFARGDMRVGTSDIDLVVVLPADDGESAEREILRELRAFVLHRAAWDLELVSVPKVATNAEWRAFEACYPAEFAHPTSVDGRLLCGQAAEATPIDAASLAADVSDSALRHLTRALFELTRVFEMGPRIPAMARLNKVATRFLRASLWCTDEGYVAKDVEVRARSAHRFGSWVTDLFAARLDAPRVWEELTTLHAQLAPKVAHHPIGDATCTFFDWHGAWMLPRYGKRALICRSHVDDSSLAEMRRLRREGYQVAILPSAILQALLRRVLPHAGVVLEQTEPAFAAGVSLDDLDREATRTLLHHRYNWRNFLLEWPDEHGRLHPQLALRMLELLDCMVTLRSGQVAADPSKVRDAFDRHFPEWPERDFIAHFANTDSPGLDAEAWVRGYPAWSRAVHAAPPLPHRERGVYGSRADCLVTSIAPPAPPARTFPGTA